MELRVWVKVSAWLFISCLCHLKGKEERKLSSGLGVRNGVLLLVSAEIRRNRTAWVWFMD